MESAAARDEARRTLGPLFDLLHVASLACDHRGRVVAVNPAAARLYGRAEEDLLGLTLAEIAPSATPEDAWLRADGAALASMSLSSVASEAEEIVRLAASDGEARYVVRRETKNVGGLDLHHLTDVTPLVEEIARTRRGADWVLHERQLVLNTAVALLSERELEPAFEILARAFAQGLGRSAVVWLPAAEGSRVLRPRAAHAVSDVGARQLETQVIDLDVERCGRRSWDERTTHVVRPEDTTTGTVEHMVATRVQARFVVAPLVGRSGPHGIVYTQVAREISDGRAIALASALGTLGGMIYEAVQLEAQATDAAARMQVLWQAASERLSDGIALLDERLRIVRVNTAQRTLLGANEGAIVGRPCIEVFEACRGEARCAHREAIEERRRIVLERFDPRLGRPLRNEVIPATSESSAIALVHVTHDLAEERAIRTQLVTTDRLATIGRLAAGVAHEINNPAAFVTVNLGVLRERFLSGTARGDEILSMLDESLNGMDRIREIVRDLKGFARERGTEDVDLGHVAQSAIRMAAHETRGRARVERLAGEPATARVRGARIAQVVLNLVINAAQAIPPGRAGENRILVRTYGLGDRAFVEVSDTGPGVAPHLRERIFEPFFTTREGSGGTGLGLWLARGIVEDEGGTLTVRDQPGGGACFVVALPSSRAASAGGARPEVETNAT